MIKKPKNAGGRPRKDNLMSNRSFRFEKNTYEQLELAAKREDKPVSDYIREVLKRAVEVENMISFPITDRKKFLPTPGVYVVKSGDRVLYVGQTVNLYQRWQSHRQLNKILEIDPEATLHFISVDTGDKSLLLTIEASLIKQLCPELNADLGRPRQNLTQPIQIRFDLDIYDLLLQDLKSSGEEVNSKVREILRLYYQSQL